jgi:Arc/MetJ-type ribon-helix-helix transcriptional regulator
MGDGLIKVEPSAKLQKPCWVPRLQWRQAMNLNLPVEAKDFVRSLVVQGKYQSEVDAVVDGIRLLKGREELRAKIAAGIAQLDRGESFNEEAVFDEVEAEIRRIESLSNQG